MSLKGSAHVEHETSDEIQQPGEVQQMIGDSKASSLNIMRSMLVDFVRNDGKAESSSAECSAAVGESPTGAGPTVVGQSPAEVGPTAVRETIVRDSGSRNFGATGRGETAVSVEVGPERDQSDQRGRAG